MVTLKVHARDLSDIHYIYIYTYYVYNYKLQKYIRHHIFYMICSILYIVIFGLSQLGTPGEAVRLWHKIVMFSYGFRGLP